jgi:hypothetical protein
MLCFNNASIYGFSGMEILSKSVGEISGNAQLFAQPLGSDDRSWFTDFPVGTQVKAMALAGDTLLVAGRLDGRRESSHALRAISTSTGKTLATIPLAKAPAHGGLSVAGGRVYLATETGQLICLGEQ